MARPRARWARPAFTWAISLVLLGTLLGIAGGSLGQGAPPLPIALDSRFVGNLSAPGLDAGQSGTLGLTLSNPLNGTIRDVELVLEVYAFNAFPGNATSSVPVAAPPLLTTASSSGEFANYTFSSIASGTRLPLSAGVVTSSTTAVGAYAVRTSLAFDAANGTAYHLASRGWFSASAWENATVEPNGSAVLTNESLRLLNVSGILPETSIQVTSSALDWALYVLLAVVFVLAGIGAYFYFARSAHSNSGAR